MNRFTPLLVLFGKHTYGLSPEEETAVAQYWLIGGLLTGVWIGCLISLLK